MLLFKVTMITTISINDQEGVSTNIPFVDLDDAHVASDDASIANSYNPDESDPEHLRQSKHILEY